MKPHVSRSRIRPEQEERKHFSLMMRCAQWGLFAGVILTSFGEGVSAAEPNAVSSIEKRLSAIERDIKEIKTMLEALAASSTQFSKQSPSAAEVVVSFDLAPAKGDPNATLILLEFSDYQCPFCGRFSRTTLSEIEQTYIKTGKLKYVLRDFPLPMHAQAAKAAEAANCAGEQGKYWEMHDALFEHQQALGLDQLTVYAKSLKLDGAVFDACLASGKFKEKVLRDFADGQRAGVSGTPSFFLGVTTDGKTIKGKAITGAKPFGFFKEIIESILAQATATK